jgi:hypothetical protein
MGANAQTSVPTFTAGEVLTAANMNISARTGIPVFATSTTRDAAFGGTGEKTLAEGQFAYLEDSNTTQYYDGAAWQAVGGASGLTLISATTIGTTVASVTVSSAFSATYDNYRITVNGGSGSAEANLNFTLGSTATGYYWSYAGVEWSGTTAFGGGANQTSFFAGSAQTAGIFLNMDIFNPFLSDETIINTRYVNLKTATTGTSLSIGGFVNNTTSYTAFTLTPSSGTLTGGTIRVYGYQNS